MIVQWTLLHSALLLYNCDIQYCSNSNLRMLPFMGLDLGEVAGNICSLIVGRFQFV